MIKTFMNFTEFYNFTNQHPQIFDGIGHIGEFRRLVTQMTSGCSCQRNRWIPAIEHNYKSVEFALSQPVRESMKVNLNASQIQLQHDGNTFFTF